MTYSEKRCAFAPNASDWGDRMNKEKLLSRLRRLVPSKRRIIQLYAALLHNANLKGYATGQIYTGPSKVVCAPGLNCYSCPGAVGACPLGSLQNALSATPHRLPYYVFGILFLWGFLFGRWICGFLCPFGLFQDLLYKIPTPKIKKSPVTRVLTALKYVILVLFAVILPLLYAFRDFPLPAFCKYICPAGTIGGALGLLSNEANTEMFGMLGPLFTWKFVLAVAFTVSVIFLYRAFCRFFCPLGALYGLFNRIALFGVKLDRSRCTDCGICYSKCKMDIRSVGDRECISCGDCVASCPTGAIRQSGARIFLAPNEIGEKPLRPAEAVPPSPEEEKRQTRKYRVRRIIAAALAGLVLLGALLYYNVFDRPATVSEGFEVGEKCPALPLDVYGGGTWELREGTLTVINFWGTWCGPCVEELPDFDRIAAEFPEAQVVAVHSSFETEDVTAYLEREYPASSITFCHDGEGEESYYTALGGKGTYPLTVIVGEDGVILARFVGAVSMADPSDPTREMGPYETLKHYLTK